MSRCRARVLSIAGRASIQCVRVLAPPPKIHIDDVPQAELVLLGDAQQLASRQTHRALPVIAFRTKRSHPRFRRRTPAIPRQPRPPTPQILETVSKRPALETRRRTLSWIEGWPRSQPRGRPWKWQCSELIALAKSRHEFLGVAQVGINSAVKSN